MWEDFVAEHLYPTGSLGYNELLRTSAPNDTPVENGQPERHHQETCATVEWLLFNARLYQATGRVRLYGENGAYDLQRPASGAIYGRPELDVLHAFAIRKEVVHRPDELLLLVRTARHRPRARMGVCPGREGVRVNLYESSEASLRLAELSVTCRQSSLYPDHGQTTLLIQPEEPAIFALRLRVPFERREIRISVNGARISSDPGADGYVRIQRTWSAGDQVEMEFDIPTHVEHFLIDRYGILVRGAEILSVDQLDNPTLDLDQLALPETLTLSRLARSEGRRRYAGEMYRQWPAGEVVLRRTPTAAEMVRVSAPHFRSIPLKSCDDTTAKTQV